MRQAVTTHNLECIGDFADAKGVWHNAQDCGESNGWRPDKRPLENKRMPHKAIVKGTSSYGESYALCLYDIPLVTYYENGNVKIKQHSSQSSGQFFWRMSPSDGAIRYWGDRLLQVETPTGTQWYQNDIDSTFVLKPGHLRDTWEVISETSQRKRTKTDLKHVAKINKALREFTTWWKGVEKLTGQPPYSVMRGAAREMAKPMPEVFTHESFELLQQSGDNLDQIRSNLFDYYGARYRVSISNDTKPLQRPAVAGDT